MRLGLVRRSVFRGPSLVMTPFETNSTPHPPLGPPSGLERTPAGESAEAGIGSSRARSVSAGPGPASVTPGSMPSTRPGDAPRPASAGGFGIENRLAGRPSSNTIEGGPETRGRSWVPSSVRSTARPLSPQVTLPLRPERRVFPGAPFHVRSVAASFLDCSLGDFGAQRVLRPRAGATPGAKALHG